MRFSKRILEMDTSAVREVLALTAKPDIISFAGGLPAPESFPVEAMRLAADRVYRTNGRSALQYGPSSGFLPLREKLAKRHREQGIACTADNFLIVSGSQQGLDLAGKVFLEPGDLVVCENPTYLAALTVFRSYECGILPIDTDDDGMVPEDLERKLAAHPKAKLMYLIPTFQNPTGQTWSLSRRKAVLSIAERYGLSILEDNPYGELRYAHILDEDRKVNAQKFESAFYADPDLCSVHAPQEEKTQPVLDAQTLLSQLQQSPELLSNLTSLILAQAGR